MSLEFLCSPPYNEKVGVGVSKITFPMRCREETKKNILKIQVQWHQSPQRREIKERVTIGSSFVSGLDDTGSVILTSL